MKTVDCRCTFACSTISDECRQELFTTFYALETYERQKNFICAHVREKETISIMDTNNKPVPKKRQRCRHYFFTVAGEEKHVCKKFFLATLSVGRAYVDHALQNSTHGTFTSNGRKGIQPHNTTLDENVRAVRQHIESFPAVESHYTRKDTQLLYLEPGLNVTKMHALYSKQCEEQGRCHVSYRIYKREFDKYRLSFHQPKKDQCSVCTIFKRKSDTNMTSESDQKEFEEHQKRKEQAREEKIADKEEAMDNPKKHVVTLDLQAVLQAPCGLVSQLYYKRKLSIFNFTIYSLADKEGKCYIWDETEGKRGANEIATCIFFYLCSLPEIVEDVIIYSDCCSGQNRNQYLAAGLGHAVKVIQNIKSITHKYLETGHTQMECDSMHSAISYAKKGTEIFTPSHWDNILRMARRNRPYIVIPVRYTDFLDFKALAAAKLRNTKTDIMGQRVNWLRLKVLRFEESRPEEILFKTSFDQSEYQTIKVSGGSKRGRKVPQLKGNVVPQLYSTKIPISSAKKEDLNYLCTSGVIPEEFHTFYFNLPSCSNARDRLPEPDVNEQDIDSD